MEKNIEIKTKTITEEVVTYVARDGRIFKNEKDCRDWEETFNCTLSTSFAKMDKIEVEPCTIGIPYDTEEHTVFVVVPKDEADINTLNLIAKNHSWGTSRILTIQEIGKKIIVEFGYGYWDKNIFGTDFMEFYGFDELRNQILNKYSEIEKKFENRNAESSSEIHTDFTESSH